MRTLICLFLSAGAAQAHLGHLGEVASHDHWVAGAAIAGALAAAAWGALKGAKEEKEPEPEEEEVKA
ncbi:MAG: DUF6732 family protein [Pseudomonadota bacterium]